jgi:hypothetical protein
MANEIVIMASFGAPTKDLAHLVLAPSRCAGLPC